jgi:nucleotide-binding universal stress UspA family protein
VDKTRIVVGVDGSAGAAAALRWAATEARLRGTELRVLTAYHRQRSGGMFTTGGEQRPAADADAAAIVHAAVAQAKAIAPDTAVRGMTTCAYAAPALLHAAEEAALLVVGDRGDGGFPALSTGSVGNQVATHAACSVVVVRGRSGANSGPVVAGVDDEVPAATIIARAFEAAALHGTPLVALTARAGRHPAPARAPSAQDVPGAGVDLELDPWRHEYPRVAARREVVAGSPDKVLVQHSKQAHLVVVGPRRHGYEGVLLGKVGTRLLQQADCPVLIARS